MGKAIAYACPRQTTPVNTGAIENKDARNAKKTPPESGVAVKCELFSAG
jgi:hypothetical protein